MVYNRLIINLTTYRFMDKETKDILTQLVQKFDTATALLLRLVPKDMEGLSLKEQIKLLKGFGVRPVDIAKIIGRSQNYINKELVAIRKEK